MSDDLLKNLRLAVVCQVMHKNALIVAVSQAVSCMHWKVLKTSTQSDGKVINFTKVPDLLFNVCADR